MRSSQAKSSATLMGSKMLRILEDLLEERRAIRSQYTRAFQHFGVTGNASAPLNERHSYYVYVLDVPNRAAFCNVLSERSVCWDIQYPTPIHLQPAHRLRFREAKLPQCDRLQQRIVSLPRMNGLTPGERSTVVAATTAALQKVCE